MNRRHLLGSLAGASAMAPLGGAAATRAQGPAHGPVEGGASAGPSLGHLAHCQLGSAYVTQLPDAFCVGHIGRPDDTPYLETSPLVEWSSQGRACPALVGRPPPAVGRRGPVTRLPMPLR